MKFEIKTTQRKEPAVYKTLYLKRSLSDRLEQIAAEHQTSFNNLVISMIESCLKEE